MRSGPRPRVLAPCLLGLLAANLGAQGDEFGSGHGVVRIEAEAKLSVPEARTEEVWQWLRARYADPSFLDRDGHRFSCTFGDELFVDRYFDTPDLQLLAWQSGIRHRSRVVMEGSAMHKDGRQLVQLKLNRQDTRGLERSEIKFEVKQRPGVDTQHQRALLALVGNSDRATLAQHIAALGIDPNGLRPILNINQNRRRAYLADQHGALATITVDSVACVGWWQTRTFTEIEIELNEIRYTQAHAEARAWMSEVANDVQRDLTTRFPDIEQDQTPKYNKGFARIEAGMPFGLPVRTLVAWRWTPGDVTGAALVAVAVAAGAVVVWIGRRRRAAAATA